MKQEKAGSPSKEPDITDKAGKKGVRGLIALGFSSGSSIIMEDP
jgi:hypothetical protein